VGQNRLLKNDRRKHSTGKKSIALNYEDSMYTEIPKPLNFSAKMQNKKFNTTN